MLLRGICTDLVGLKSHQIKRQLTNSGHKHSWSTHPHPRHVPALCPVLVPPGHLNSHRCYRQGEVCECKLGAAGPWHLILGTPPWKFLRLPCSVFLLLPLCLFLLVIPAYILGMSCKAPGKEGPCVAHSLSHPRAYNHPTIHQ